MAAATKKQTSTTPSTMVETRLFGSIEIPEEHRLVIPDGIIGFSSCTEFALLPAGPEHFYWLQSLEHSTLAFLLVDPFPFFSGYAVDLPDATVAELSASTSADVSVLAIVTLSGPGEGATANLQGPLLLNLSSRKGAQFVVPNSAFGTREQIPADRMPA